jgi:hypothetical protein
MRAGLRGCALDAEWGSQASQSQASQADERGVGARGTPAPGAAPGATPGGAMPPPARKLVALRRALSPPAARNVFADGPGDDSASHAAGLLRALPVVARYRCAALRAAGPSASAARMASSPQ